ncbi:MAG: hypothetical protein JOY80_00160 [Candidatus Dormibacteraeota bacterium]|nr:hypothetical protein [Candidatus Dormibacteraeota bacterium]
MTSLESVTRARRWAAVALVATAAGACGSATSAPTPSPSPAVKRFSSATFSAVIPKGWSDHTMDQREVQSINADGMVLMLLIAAHTTANIGNEHIDVSVVAQPVPDDQLLSYLQSVSQNGAANVSQPEPFALGGSSGLFVTYDLMSNDNPPKALRSQDMIVNHAGETYEIVLNTAAADFDAQQSALNQVLQTWQWTQ